MIITICIAALSVISMLICIFRFPTIRLKHVSIDSFYIPVLIGALILLIFPIFDKTELITILTSDSSLNPLKILVLFLCVSILSIALDQTGFFQFIASKFIRKYKSSQFKLFFVLYALISILTIFTSNDIVILTFTPFILYFCKKGNIRPIPYLVMEFVAANTYSMVLSIGNPTNIYLSSAYNIAFLDYFIYMIFPTLLCGLTGLGILFLMFRKDLKQPIQTFDFQESTIQNKPLCIIALIHLSLATIFLAISNIIHLQMWIICLCFASSLLLILLIHALKTKRFFYLRSTIRRVPYNLVPFILSMFVILMALESYNIFTYVYEGFSKITNHITEPILYLITSTLTCNIINNIPMTLAYGSILSHTENIKLIYATIIGSNIGAILTPVGALAGIMWLRILRVNEIKYTTKDFIQHGSILVLGLLIAASVALLIL